MDRQTCQALAALSGRVFLSAIFLVSGFGKIADWTGTAALMSQKGMPLVPVLLAGAIAFEVLGGLSILVGFGGRIGAAALIVYLIPTTLIFHSFWAVEATQQQNQMIHFMKNLAIMGGLFVVAALGTNGYSLDRRVGRPQVARPRRAEHEEPMVIGQY